MTDHPPDNPPPADQFVSNCDDLLRVINQYVDGEIDPGLCENFEQYMSQCNPCRVVVDNIRRTIRLYKDDQEIYEMPLDCRRRLHDCLKKRWRQMHGGG